MINMTNRLRIFGTLSSIAAFSLCCFGGVWALVHSDFKNKDDVLQIAIGFYFLGKSIFVGALLLLVSLQERDQKRGKD